MTSFSTTQRESEEPFGDPWQIKENKPKRK